MELFSILIFKTIGGVNNKKKVYFYDFNHIIQQIGSNNHQ